MSQTYLLSYLQVSSKMLFTIHDTIAWYLLDVKSFERLAPIVLLCFLLSGLYPTAFFLWKNYLVLMPDVDCSREERSVRSAYWVSSSQDNKKKTLFNTQSNIKKGVSIAHSSTLAFSFMVQILGEEKNLPLVFESWSLDCRLVA